MFYYITIKAPSASFTVNVTQSNDKGWKPIPVQGTKQIILYEANCAKSSKGTPSYNATTGTATLNVTGATAGASYVVGIKYSLSGLTGQAVASPPPGRGVQLRDELQRRRGDPVQPGQHHDLAEAVEERSRSDLSDREARRRASHQHLGDPRPSRRQRRKRLQRSCERLERRLLDRSNYARDYCGSFLRRTRDVSI